MMTTTIFYPPAQNRNMNGLLCMLCFAMFTVAARAAETNTPQALPRLPWHLADLWWNFAEPTPHFKSLDMDVTIDRDVPTNVNLYISPCGTGELSGVKFYGGFQSNTTGWKSKDNHERVHIGRGVIFSRWGKGQLSVAQARGANDSIYEAAGYEGDFVSVRRPFTWNKGTYTWSLRACDSETVGTNVFTWISCFVTAHDTGATHYIGSLRFEGADLTFWNKHGAFVEIYSTTLIPHSEIPEVKVTFGYNTDFVVETSDTLTGTWNTETVGGNVAISDNDVKYTFPAPLGSKRFARLRVTGPQSTR